MSDFAFRITLSFKRSLKIKLGLELGLIQKVKITGYLSWPNLYSLY